MKNKKSAVYYIALVYSILCAIGFILCLVLLILKKLDWITFLIYIVSSAVQLILLWSLENALDRIETLENILIEKKVISEKEIDTPSDEDMPEPPETISFCDNCGFQIFPDDEVCPNCQTKIVRKKDTNKS